MCPLNFLGVTVYPDVVGSDYPSESDVNVLHPVPPHPDQGLSVTTRHSMSIDPHRGSIFLDTSVTTHRGSWGFVTHVRFTKGVLHS